MAESSTTTKLKFIIYRFCKYFLDWLWFFKLSKHIIWYFSAKPSSSSSPTNETGNGPNSDEPPPETGDEPLPAPPPEPPKEDGVLLYLAIKVKDEFKDEDEVDNNMRKLFRNDYNNNPGTIQKKVKHSVFKTITNEKGKKIYSWLVQN